MMAVIGIESDRSYTLSGNETVSLSHQHMNTYLIKVTLYSTAATGAHARRERLRW